LNDPLRVRIFITVIGLMVSALLFAAAINPNEFLSYESLTLVRSVYTSAAGIVFILSLLPWALADSSSKPRAG
jgi:hypothetical protein